VLARPLNRELRLIACLFAKPLLLARASAAVEIASTATNPDCLVAHGPGLKLERK